MRFSILLLAFGLLLGSAGGLEVAFVAGQAPNEADAFTPENGWRLTRYQDTELDKLMGEIDRYALVIWGSLAGYEKKLDWPRHNQALKKYLENGGFLLALDANYDSATDDIFGSWGADFRLKRNPECAMRQRKKGDTPKIVREESVASIPYALAGLFDAYADGWSHFEAPPRPWRVLARCPDGAAFAVARPVGKGGVAVLAYGMFNLYDRRVTLEAMASNLLAAQRLGAARVAVTRYDLSDQFGASKADIALTGAVEGVAADVLLGDDVIASRTLAAGDNEIPFDVAGVGTLRLVLKKDGNTLASRHVAVKPPVTLAVARYAIYPLIAKNIRLDVTAGRDEFLAPPYRCEFRVDGEAFAALAPTGPATYAADFSALAPGEHEIALRLVDAETGRAIFDDEPVPFEILAKDPRVALTPRGFFAIEGKPFFPLGLYHVSRHPGLPVEKRGEALRFAKENGFNTLHVSMRWGESRESFQPFLDAAHAAGVMILPESDQLAQSVRRGESPALLGWDIGDEPDLEGISGREFRRRLRAFKALDAEALSYTVFMNLDSFAKYWPVTEIVAVDPYPVPRFPLGTVHEHVAKARDALAGTPSGLVAVLQGFGYENDPVFTLPTARQARNMLYQALVAGARGVIFYTYQDGRFYLPDHPELCAFIKGVPAEIKPLEDFLLDGEYRALPVERAGVYAAEWKTADRTLTLVVNTTDAAVKAEVGGVAMRLGPEAVEIRK